MRTFNLLLVLAILVPAAGVPPREQTVYETLKNQAEQSYAEKSFSRAHDLYAEAAKAVQTAEEKRWTAMRLADTAWRASAANRSGDPTVRSAARESLEALLRDGADEHDRAWAEAQESLGDFKASNDYGMDRDAITNYDLALQWWAGSTDLELARRRYLELVFKMVEPSHSPYGPRLVANIGNVSRDVLANATAIARTPEDKAHTQILFALTLLSENTPDSIERGLELLGKVMAAGRTTKWYADALATAADRYAQGVPIVDDDGSIAWRPDYARALELYHRIVADFRRDETRYYEPAQNRIVEIESPSVRVMVGSTFLPRSEQEFAFAWRNVKDVKFTITPVDLIDDAVIPTSGYPGFNDFRPHLAPVRQWSFATNDSGGHVPGQQEIRIQPKLEPGAYVVEAAADGKSSKERLLVTDANVLAHASGGRTDLFVCNAVTGAPIGNARVRVWQDHAAGPPVIDLRSDDNGFVSVRSDPENSRALAIAVVAPQNRQAFATTYAYGYRNAVSWRIYAFTDRPAYRPEETVHWKIVARTRSKGEWTTPAHASIDYMIRSPRGEKVAAGTAALNEYGTFWADLPLTPSMPLGAYNVVFTRHGDHNENVGYAQLFRLEEYKLPEYRVDVKTAEENGRKKIYRSGDTIEAVVEASYYFGGPVANANVEVHTSSHPSFHRWQPWRVYDWYYDAENNYGYGGGESKSETLKTDANGRAVVHIETSPDDPDREYVISARVTDSSRREVQGSGSVRVGRNSYTVIAHPRHYLYPPGNTVTVDFKALDANDQPVETNGNVTVVRRWWDEVWIDPAGRDIGGRELASLRASSLVFPPRPEWRQKFRGYREEDVQTFPVTTSKDGSAAVKFVAPGDGYYTIRWKSVDRIRTPKPRARDVISAETSVWVSRRSVDEIGYHAGGLEIIVDRDSFRSGETAPVMIATPATGQWVFVTTSGDGILDSRILHLDGTVKLLEVPLDDRHTPSFFITASSVYDTQLASNTTRIVVPPVAHFIDVGVKADRDEYRPRGEGAITVTTRDVDGKPVAAEVALSVSDEAVTAIQADTAGDPRKFFFENRRSCPVQPFASVQGQRYVTLVEEEKKLIDARIAARKQASNALKKDEDELEGGVEQGVVGGVVGGVMPPPPVSAPLRMEAKSVAEAITVTASAPAVPPPPPPKPAPGGIDVVVRSDFRSTAFWQPDIATGPDGVAIVKLKFPESLTTWRATARAVSAASQVGMGSEVARTSMPLLVRLEAPRFFVAGDRVTISAVVNNNTGRPIRVRPSIAAEGVRLATAAESTPIEVAANGESRADWSVIAERSGSAKLRVTAVVESDSSLSDAMEKSFVVYEHGIDKLVARSGKLRGDEAVIKLDLPAARRATSLAVLIQPSLATTMLDALPYLVDFPYGCTEQTMSRFLPAAIVARTLARNGLSRDDIEARIFGGIERSSISRTHPGQSPSLDRLGRVIADSKARLVDFQHSDGGWGWWKEGNSDAFMTAYVVWGFAVLRSAEGNVPSASIDRAVRFLDNELVKHENDRAMQAWMLHAIASWRAATGSNATEPERRAFENVYAKREQLTAYSRALLALAAHDLHDSARAEVLIHNLEDGVKIDRTPDRSVLVHGSGSGAAEIIPTAHWGEDRFWWRWHDGPVESTSFVLQALMAIDPKNPLVEPAMNWLVKNRRGAQWNNTRDTAIALLGLDDYLRGSGELSGDASYELVVNGRSIATRHVSRSEVLSAPSRFEIDPDLVRDANDIRIRRTAGSSPLYFSAEARFVSLEEPVKAAGNEIFVRRDYFRMAPHPTLLNGVTYDRVPLVDGGSLDSGDRVEVVLTIETKNDYDYLLLEDLKPAGLEAVSLRSGEPLYARQVTAKAVERKFGQGAPAAVKTSVRPRSDTAGRMTYVYQELRDRKVALFIDHLPQGIWEIRYTLRGEVPGSFHALPLLGQAMYVPEIRGNGEEARIEVK